MFSAFNRLKRSHVITYKHLFAQKDSIMSVSTISSREFTRDVAAAKRAAVDGPVFITDRGKPSFALLRIEEYHRITGHRERTLLEVMDSIPGGGEFEFDPPKLDIALKIPDFDNA
jgi:PHD/YefM family antitoxin component YafN of YafNO toxin-antitoxin module